MSEITIQVPPKHLEAVRQSLIGLRSDAMRREEVESLLDQIASDAPDRSRPCALTGSRAVLWSAIYDSLCTAAERLAEDCNDYWRGTIDPEAARAAVAAVGARLELLVALGRPPASS